MPKSGLRTWSISAICLLLNSNIHSFNHFEINFTSLVPTYNSSLCLDIPNIGLVLLWWQGITNVFFYRNFKRKFQDELLDMCPKRGKCKIWILHTNEIYLNKQGLSCAIFRPSSSTNIGLKRSILRGSVVELDK